MAEKAKIMVVEDNDFVRMQIVKFLQDEGYDPVECPDGQVAIDTIDDDIAAAIVDVRMDPIDGFEFLRLIRAAQVQTPVILVTGDQNPDLLNESAKLGVAAVLMKPVQRERLIKTLSRMLQTRSRSSQ